MASKQDGRIVAMDSMTLVWGVRKNGNESNLERARILFDQLERDDATIIIPSIVVAEFLAGMPEHEREMSAVAIGKRFQVEPFDVRDAVLASQLWDYGSGRRKNGHNAGSRTCLKADVLIVAIARNRGAREFYSEDADCLAIASRAKLIAKKLPTMDEYIPFKDAINVTYATKTQKETRPEAPRPQG